MAERKSRSERGGSDPLPRDIAERLAIPAAYPHDRGAQRTLDHIETHISHVFLTAEHVYKIRKPVALPFLDFSRRSERNADCLREIALNRRLAPDVYLGVAPLLDRADGGLELGATAEGIDSDAADHAVVMRRLPEGRDAHSLAIAGALSARQVDSIADLVARFHGEHALRVQQIDPDLWILNIHRAIDDAIELARTGGLDPEDLDRLGALVAQRRPACEQRLRRRLSQGRAVDGHGDMHLQHVWFERDDAPPAVIDCIEFREDWRRLDPASEVAFLAMDLRYRGAPELAERLLRRYALLRDDFDSYAVVDDFIAYRAIVRGAVAGVAAADAELPAAQRSSARSSARRHLDLAIETLCSKGAGALLVMCGTVGSGKSTAARTAADAIGDAAVIATDVTRKHLPQTAAGPYSADAVAHTYREVLARAEPVLESGRVAILDGTFSRARDRQAALEVAHRFGAPALLVEARCSQTTAILRVQQRERLGDDASDAGPEQVAASRERFEAAGEWPAGVQWVIDTDAEGWQERLRARLAGLRRR